MISRSTTPIRVARCLCSQVCGAGDARRTYAALKRYAKEGGNGTGATNQRPKTFLVDFIRQLRRWYWRSRRRVEPPPAPWSEGATEVGGEALYGRSIRGRWLRGGEGHALARPSFELPCPA